MLKTGIINSTKDNGSSNNRRFKRLSQNKLVAARIVDIVLDENHPKFNDVGQWNGIGAIFYEFVNKIGSSNGISYALPYDSQIKTYPLINEIVLLFSLPSQQMGITTSNESYFYLNPLGIWNHPHHDAYPNPININKPSISQDKTTEIDLNSPINPSQNTFVEKTDIHPLMPFMGDSLLEGRHGQSIRFGSTAKSNSEKKNNWSSAGNNGDPITILRNGQPSKTSDRGWIPITEDLNNDLSSIYLTSYQKLPFKIKSLSEYSQPQIVLNSDRVVINSKEDSIFLNSNKNIQLSSTNQINIESPKTYFTSQDIRLGSQDATEPLLKGDATNDLLKELTNAVNALAQLLTIEKSWPKGALVTRKNLIASSVVTQLKNITYKLNNNSLKSQTTKVK